MMIQFLTGNSLIITTSYAKVSAAHFPSALGTREEAGNVTVRKYQSNEQNYKDDRIQTLDIYLIKLIDDCYSL